MLEVSDRYAAVAWMASWIPTANLTTVIRECSARIWDVGDMEYPMIKPFLDNLPRDQLAEIELASPVRQHAPVRCRVVSLIHSTSRRIRIGCGSFSSWRNTHFSTSVVR